MAPEAIQIKVSAWDDVKPTHTISTVSTTCPVPSNGSPGYISPMVSVKDFEVLQTKASAWEDVSPSDTYSTWSTMDPLPSDGSSRLSAADHKEDPDYDFSNDQEQSSGSLTLVLPPQAILTRHHEEDPRTPSHSGRRSPDLSVDMEVFCTPSPAHRR